MTPVVQDSTTPEVEPDALHQARKEFLQELVHRREQKIINAIGAQLNMDSVTPEFLSSISARVTYAHDIQTADESWYLDGKLLITFKPPVITVDGGVMTAQQGYGPVGL